MDILNEKIEGLVKKAEKSGMPYGILKKVYDRGMAAWKTGHRPGTTPQQWAFARVNSFVTKSSGTWGKADKDLAKQVRGESIEAPRTKSAKELIGQIKEKLPKDADAGDYVKDFRKSKAPQFKGKSDKKIQKMAIAAYLDSKGKEEETNLEESKMKELAGRVANVVMKMKKDRDMKGFADKFKKDVMKSMDIDKSLNKVLPDYIAGKDIAALMKEYYEIGTDNYVNYLKDITPGEEKQAEYKQIAEEKKKCPRCVAINETPFDKCHNCGLPHDKFATYDKKEEIQESGHTDVPSMKNQVQIAMDALQKMNTELGKLSDEEELPTWWTNKVATAVSKLDGMADYIDAKHDQGQKMNEENLQEKERTYTVIHIKKGKEIIKTSKGTYDAAKKYAKMKGLKSTAGVDVHLMEDNITEQKVFVVRFEKEGMRFAVPFSDMKRAKDGEKILKKSAGVSNVSVTKDILKPGVSMSKFRTQQEGKINIDKDYVVENPMVHAAALATSVWAERRHMDPADVDVKATAADRKAADKNIIIQLRRAQDMEKQTGRADQSGIEFLDKKKQKVDPKIINKALDMFDKMKPNDKQKMQQSIGKSYRDLLKTVQRGRV